jgi:serine/threonine protein kinase
MDNNVPQSSIKPENNEIKLLNQGTYGCVFKPGIDCDGEPERNIKIITKVQILNTTNQNEINIGKIIMSIPQYETYFAPIIKSCPVNINKLPNDEKEKCKIFNTNTNNAILTNQQYITNKIRYVSDKTLQTYLENIVSKEKKNNEKILCKKLKQTMTHCLIAIEKLFKKGLIHNDITIMNILYDENNSSPIIIDFGLSIIPSEIQNSNANNLYKQYSNAFYTFTVYPYWCIEHYFISYIINKNCPDEIKTNPNPNPTEHKLVTKDKVDELIEGFVLNNPLFKKGFIDTEINNFKRRMKRFFEKYIGNNSTWKSVLDDLFQEINYSTWDNYSLAVVYLQMITNDDLKKYENNVKIKKLVEYLKNIILSVPTERLTTQLTKKFIRTL